MNRRSHNHAGIFCAARVVLTLTLLASVSGSLTQTTRGQDDPLKALSDEYAELERQGLKENFHRQLSYQMLLPYLPPGTRMTSGYRSPQKQLDLILRMARAHNINTPASADINDENSWRPALMALRQQGFIIAAPTTTPHATDEAVFDMSGADLNAIQDGCRRAEKAGMVKFKKIIFETQNNAVHVEIESISPKAFSVLGQRKAASAGSSSASSGGGDASSTAASEADQRRSVLQQLQDSHDREPDPIKKIDYDRSLRNLLDPSADAEKIKALDDEIKRHQTDAQQLSKEGQKKQAIDDLSAALREDRYEDAERAALFLQRKYPDVKEAQGMLAQLKTRRLIIEATDALDQGGCRECERANQLIDEALQLSPEHEGAKLIQEDASVCLKHCRTKRISFVALIVVVFIGLIAGVYFLMSRAGAPAAGGVAAEDARPADAYTWVLEGLAGACAGQIYPVNKSELIVGSQGPPNGTADIVICDAERKISRQHCTVMQNNNHFYLIDNSTNGTKINDQELERGLMTEFRNGDRISLAEVAVLTLRPK